VFALPFALVGALLAGRVAPLTLARVGWIVAAMVTARSAAMGFNRLVDARWDGLNPRTSMREIPRGAMSRREAVTFVLVMSAAFVAGCWPLGMACFVLSPVALAIVFWYSLAKRVTHLTQLFLGLAMAVAPVGGWIAAGGGWSWQPVWLAAAIAAWVGGFDVLYACQDLDFDRAHGLRSIPVRLGVARSLTVSRALHAVTVCCLGALGQVAGLGPVYHAGVAGVAVLLVYEQSLVSADDLSQVKRAFDLNGYVGLLFLVTTGVALYVG
jgi:4-hydroxybenzoate polyprenyltransferase